MMKTRLLQVLLCGLMSATLLLTSCVEDDGGVDPPVASFTFVVNGASVTFTNTSTGTGNEYSWDFGDDATSNLESPSKDYTTAGTFTVTLTATNDGGSDTATEEVTIDAAAVDTQAPVITLTGDAAVSVEIGEEYTDAGATANDNVDGDISDDIVVTGEVDTLVPGEYTLAYNVSDAAGNEATEVTRTVTVTFDDGLLTNGDFETENQTAWIGNALDIRTEGGNSFAFVDVATAGNSFDVNISQVLPMSAGNTYTLSFNASTSAEDETRTLLAGIGLNVEPFTNVTEEVTITSTTQRFSFEFVANFDNAESRVLFDMGAAAGIVVLDNVSLELTAENTSTLPFDFEDGEEIVDVFNGAAFEVAEDPADANNKVGKVTNAGVNFEGISFALGTAVDFATDKQISMRFNTATADIPVLVKFESGTAGDIEVSATAASTGWQDLTFDFSGTAGSYKKLVVFIDGPGTAAGDFYIDDIKQEAASGGGGQGGCTGTLVAATTTPVTFEACETFLASQNFGTGLSSELVANPFKEGINTSDYVLKVDKTNGAEFFGGIQNTFSSALDFTDDVLKLKVYSTKANVVFRFELILNPNPDALGNPAPQFATIENANEWTQVEVPFTGFPVSADAYNQLVIKPDNDQSDSPITADGTYYIDDIETGPATVTGTPGDYCGTQVKHFGGNVGSEALLTIEKVTRGDGFPALKFTIATDPTNGLVPDLVIVNTLEGSPGLEAMDTSVSGEVSIQAFWPSGAPANNETTFQVLWSFEGEAGNWQLFETVTDTRVSVDATCE